MSAITAITAQSTVGVSAIHEVPPEIVLAQVRTVVADMGVDAVKVGMLGTARVIRAVAVALDELPAGTAVVVDPVMLAESGARLLDADAEGALIGEILPRATVLTPNLPEARALAGATDGDQEPTELARAVIALGPRAVVVTGGHGGRGVDLYLDATGRLSEIGGERHPDGAAHGSGCTHSSLLAARLALGDSPLQAARIARDLAGEAVARGLRDLGAGAGPVDVLGLDARRRPVREHDSGPAGERGETPA
jgi:hydroxymethylpyrimidine/phosphomethylpyrimidine kinase